MQNGVVGRPRIDTPLNCQGAILPYTATVYHVIITSPSDTALERDAIAQAIYDWNAVNSTTLQVVLLPRRWESEMLPQMGDRPQSLLNAQIVDSSDLMIATFWTRLGSHTGAAESGSVEEIQQFLDANKPVLLYFSSVPVVPGTIDLKQLEKLNEFKSQRRSDALYAE